ncbi:MAG: ABC transporter ATP-binding protein [Clostridia bacterium]|nr:ABC transporter ATP-binding protein [Clostridia bacterium]
MAKSTQSKSKIWLDKNVGKYTPSIVFLTVLNVLATVCSVGFAYLSSFLINSATKNDDSGIILFSCIVLSLLIGRVILRAGITFWSEKSRATIITDLRSRLFRKVLKSNYKDVEKYHSGELLTRITVDSAEIAGTTVGFIPQTVGILVQIVGAIIALLDVDFYFTIFLIVGGAIIIGISAFLRKKTKWFYKEIMKADGKSRSFMQESVVSELTIKSFGAEEKTANKADKILDFYKQRRIGRAKLTSLTGILYALVTNVGLVFAIIWCAFGITKGMDYGAVLAIVLLMEQLQRPLNSVSAIMPAYYSRQASAERLCEIDEFDEEETQNCNPISYDEIQSVSVKNATFYYDKEKVLDDFSIDFEKNKTTCLYGVSGGGKSTLFKLLLGVYSLNDGEIGFNTDDGFKKISAEHRNLFAFVPQGNFLFSGTVYENLTFFSDENDQEILKQKVKKAIENSCSEFVYDLPDGLDTVLNEQGGGLSEGQKQRLAVARAFLTERPILLLDEATSALDEETEGRLIENIKNMKDKTCIIISHRQAVIDFADKSVKIGE